MAEYLSPGVYVEEFDSGIKAMEGVGTSTAGFLGMAAKGPVKGVPVLITSFAEYQRRFGGYLPERTYGSLRFMPYAVEQFFANGGSACYCMRVCRTAGEGAAFAAKGSLGTTNADFLTVQASNPGAWGNSMIFRLTRNPKGKTKLTKGPQKKLAEVEELRKACEEPRRLMEDASKNLEKANVELAYKKKAQEAAQKAYDDKVAEKEAREDEKKAKTEEQNDKATQKDILTDDLNTASDNEKEEIQKKIDAITEEMEVIDNEIKDIESKIETITQSISTRNTAVTDAKTAAGTAQTAVDTDESALKETTEAYETAIKAYENAMEDACYVIKDVRDLQPGDLVCVTGKTGSNKEEVKTSDAYAKVKRVEGNKVWLESDLSLTIDDSSGLSLAEWDLTVSDGMASEQFASVSFNPARSNFISNMILKSQLLEAEVSVENITNDCFTSITLAPNGEEPFFEFTLSGGTDAKVQPSVVEADLYNGKDGEPGERTGLCAFLTLSDVSIMLIPGITDAAVQTNLVTHCENKNDRFAILDMPEDAREVTDLQAFRENIDSSYAAMYHPWLQCYDMLARKNAYMPPSGAMAGIYARTDNTRGVFKAPANEIVKNCTGLSVKYNEAEQGKLNPKGINLIRSLSGQGIRVWGARTCSSDGNWKYINVRRLFIYIEQSIKVNTNWAVFEPNNEMLWSRVEGTIKVFLTSLWRDGALSGGTQDEAFFVNIGSSTMTQDDILNGRLICVIGVAPVRPAEFVIFRITQKMESAQ